MQELLFFFVLSGFLIISLLLKESVNTSLKTSFLNFYVRRSLRIFPIYYLYLLLVFAIDYDGIQKAGYYPWFYLTNFYIFKENTWLLANSHLWSLSLEEQFYLVIPFLVLFFRNKIKWLTGIFLSFCLFSMLLRLYLSSQGYSASPQLEVFTWANLDYLSLGGLLAIGYQKYGTALRKYGIPALIIGVLIYYLSAFLLPYYDVFYWTIGKLSLGFMALGIILYCLKEEKTIVQFPQVVSLWKISLKKYSILDNPITRHLGKISYGIYLYHNLLVASYDKIWNFLGVPIGSDIYFKILGSLVLVLAVSELSYFFIEKSYFEI